jgi:hypothetical protein
MAPRLALPPTVAALVAKHPDLGELAFNFAAALQRSEAVVQAEWDEVDRLLGAPPPPPAEADAHPPQVGATENMVLCSLAHPFNAWAQVWFDEASVPADIPRARLLRLTDLGVSPLLAAKLYHLFRTHDEAYERLLRIEERLADIRPYDGETVEEFDERRTGMVEYFDLAYAEFEAMSEELRPYRRVLDLGALLFDEAHRHQQAWERRRLAIWLLAPPPPAPAVTTFDLVDSVLAFVRALPPRPPHRDVASEVLEFTAAHYAAVHEARLTTEFQALAQACEA